MRFGVQGSGAIAWLVVSGFGVSAVKVEGFHDMKLALQNSD